MAGVVWEGGSVVAAAALSAVVVVAVGVVSGVVA